MLFLDSYLARRKYVENVHGIVASVPPLVDCCSSILMLVGALILITNENFFFFSSLESLLLRTAR